MWRRGRGGGERTRNEERFFEYFSWCSFCPSIRNDIAPEEAQTVGAVAYDHNTRAECIFHRATHRFTRLNKRRLFYSDGTKYNDSRGLAELEKEKVSLKTRLQEAAEKKQWDAVQELSNALSATELRIENAKKEEKDLLRLSKLESRKRELKAEVPKATSDDNYARVGEIAKALKEIDREIKDLRAKVSTMLRRDAVHAQREEGAQRASLSLSLSLPHSWINRVYPGILSRSLSWINRVYP